MVWYVGYVIVMNQLLCVFLFTAMEAREGILEMTYCTTKTVPHLELVHSLAETLECGELLMVDMLHFQVFKGNKKEEVDQQSIDRGHPER